MKRNAFGQLVPANPRLRFFAPAEGEGGGGDEFKAPASQEDLDKIVNDRLARERKKFEGYEDYKSKAEKWEAHEAEKNKPKPEDKPKDEPKGVSEGDVDERIKSALAAKDKELAIERVSDQLDKALESRSVSASKLFNLDRATFVNEDGKTVNSDAIKEWVEKNSSEVAGPSPRRLRGQGERSETQAVDNGRAAYERRHKKNT